MSAMSLVSVEPTDSVDAWCEEARTLASRIDLLLARASARADSGRDAIRIAQGLAGTLADQLDVVARRRR